MEVFLHVGDLCPHRTKQPAARPHPAQQQLYQYILHRDRITVDGIKSLNTFTNTSTRHKYPRILPALRLRQPRMPLNQAETATDIRDKCINDSHILMQHLHNCQTNPARAFFSSRDSLDLSLAYSSMLYPRFCQHDRVHPFL